MTEVEPQMSREEFRNALVEGMSCLGLEVETLAEKFQVSIPTVKRWLEGRSCPQAFLRKSVIEYLVVKMSLELLK